VDFAAPNPSRLTLLHRQNNMKKMCARVVLLALLLVGAAQAEVAVPPLAHRVTDLTATLDAQQTQALESASPNLKQKRFTTCDINRADHATGNHRTIRPARGRGVETGRKGVDDGALLLVAKDDRSMRIEVGYGLEGALNDATAKRIIAETITPFFKRGEFYPVSNPARRR